MARTVSVVFRKEDIQTAVPALKGRHAVVIDVLRASSTIVTALSNGARDVRLTATPKDAIAVATALPASSRVLGGERGGVLIPGFDLGNSPRDYSAARIDGKSLIFTTTNGTAALAACLQMGVAGVRIGCLLNAAAVARVLATGSGEISLVCAGTEGVCGIDDIYTAGAIIERLLKHTNVELDDSARVAFAAFRSSPSAAEVFRQSLGGRNLIRVGLGSDLDDCAKADSRDVVPFYDLADGAIVAR